MAKHRVDLIVETEDIDKFMEELEMMYDIDIVNMEEI